MRSGFKRPGQKLELRPYFPTDWLQISDRIDMGAQNFDFTPKFATNEALSSLIFKKNFLSGTKRFPTG